MPRHNKKHHKIPKTYLERFTDSEGFVWIADRNLNLYPQKPINTLTENDYYTIRFRTGGGTLNVETKFLGGIETRYSKIYKQKLEGQQPISQEDKAKLSIFVASMLERQPMTRQSLEKFFSEIEEHITHMRGLPDHVKEKMASVPVLSGSGPSFSADELLEAGKDVSSLHSSLIPDTVVDIAPIIFDMKWAFMVKPEKSEPFITSDNPCVMVDPVGEAEFGRGTFGAAPGFVKKHIELTLPLSKNMALLCGWKLEHDCFYITVPEGQVKNINLRTKRHADYVIGHDKKMLEEMIERVKAFERKTGSK